MDLKTRDEAAKYLRVSLRTLDKLTAEKEIIAARIGGPRRGRVVYPQENIDAYITRQLEAAAR
jgi:excisionase family DNA binding protein